MSQGYSDLTYPKERKHQFECFYIIFFFYFLCTVVNKPFYICFTYALN